MFVWNATRLLALGLIGAAMLGRPLSLNAQTKPDKDGFARVLEVSVGGTELISQPRMWVYETHFKKIRMLRTMVTDPKTGKRRLEFIWYLVFKVVNRDLNRFVDTTDTLPQNVEDAQPQELFLPELTLVTDDNNKLVIYDDVVLPEVQAEIAKRERLDQPLLNTVQLVGSILPIAAEGEPEKVLYGVAIWRGVDPKTDFFRVFLTGFSNGYQLAKGPDGKPLLLRKTIVQEFWRPGDEFEQEEVEIRFKGDARWIYRADPPAPPSAQPAPAKPAPTKPAPAKPAPAKTQDENSK